MRTPLSPAARECGFKVLVWRDFPPVTGIDLPTVQSILIHSAASTTLNKYGHVIPGAKRDAVNRLDQMLRRKVSGE